MAIRVLLVHAGVIPHYRVPIYGYLSEYLRRDGFDLAVVSDGLQEDSPCPVEFQYSKMRLSAAGIARTIVRRKIDVVIDYMELRHKYLFPTYVLAKGILRRKMIYWGQGRDLLDAESKIKNAAYALELAMSDAIVLYAKHLIKYVPPRFHKKVFVANNTICFDYKGFRPGVTREDILASFRITTKKNIICVGRMQKRKRLDQLFEAFKAMRRPDVGLILAGPDPEGLLRSFDGENVFKPGPIYGDGKYDLLSSADVYCLPGAVGLSIVDAFFCGLPLVTEEGDESAEIAYLKDGVNGFVVRRGDTAELTRKLSLLLEDDDLRKRFSDAAKREMSENANMDLFCSGFRAALFHAMGK